MLFLKKCGIKLRVLAENKINQGKEGKGMEKRIKFSEQPLRVKIIYSVVVAVLCITAIVIATISVANKKEEMPSDPTPPSDTDSSDEGGAEENIPSEPEKVVYTAPIDGEIVKSHSLDTPVFSATLGDFIDGQFGVFQ